MTLSCVPKPPLSGFNVVHENVSRLLLPLTDHLSWDGLNQRPVFVVLLKSRQKRYQGPFCVWCKENQNADKSRVPAYPLHLLYKISWHHLNQVSLCWLRWIGISFLLHAISLTAVFYPPVSLKSLSSVWLSPEATAKPISLPTLIHQFSWSVLRLIVNWSCTYHHILITSLLLGK